MTSLISRNAALWTGALTLAAAFTALPALADDDKNKLAISEVFVNFEDPNFGN